jgi:ABC-type phosphate transport system substrate-binding protein
MRSANRVGWVLLALALGVGPDGAAADVVVIVSTKSEIAKLTRSEVADIFLGKASRLPEAGRVEPLDQPEGSAARDEFYETFAGKSAAQIKAHWSKIIFTGRGQPPAQVADGLEARKRVAENPNIIAYVEREQVDDSVRIVSP